MHQSFEHTTRWLVRELEERRILSSSPAISHFVVHSRLEMLANLHAKREKSMLRKVALWDGSGGQEEGCWSLHSRQRSRSLVSTRLDRRPYTCEQANILLLSHAMVGDGKARESAKPALCEINPPSWLPQFSDSVELGG